MSNILRHTPPKVIIVGAGGHARVIADIIQCSGDEVAGFLDDDPKEFPGIKLLGRVKDAVKLRADNMQFIIGIGNNETRKRIAGELKGIPYYTAVHPSAVIAKDAIIGVGTAVMANAVVNTGSKVGKHCIINTAATVDHDNKIKSFVHLSPGVHLSGTVSIGEGAWLGTGTVVRNNVTICGGCTVGAGAVVVEDITEAGIYIGVPAKMSINITE